MNTFYGCWIFDDRVGAQALNLVRHSRSQLEHTELLSWDGPSMFAGGSQSTRLECLSSARENDSSAIHLVWDGRLDNQAQLLNELGVAPETSQASSIAAAYRKWGTSALAHLRGDWTLTLWDSRNRTLLLAKDPMGARPLYYVATAKALFWSNSIEWLLGTSGVRGNLNLEYLAGWLSFFAEPQHTPYAHIHGVPPASFVCVNAERQVTQQYWEFPESELLRYRDEREYEEHFRSVFANSVRRCLVSEKPLLAELSGGMDSSSIVCIADRILKEQLDLTPRLDTLSFYDDSEPNWNERPYFSLIEAKRGRQGVHHQLDPTEGLASAFNFSRFAATPAELGSDGSTEQLLSDLATAGYEAVLSGVGGDEFTGGVPTPIPELADLFVSCHLRALGSRLKDWSLSQRRPLLHVLANTVSAFLPFSCRKYPGQKPPSWLTPNFRKRYRRVFSGYDKPLRPWGRPSFQECLSTVEALRRQLAASAKNPRSAIEKRYPYLDVDLLQFLFSVPRRLLVKPGRRRYLMRRSLVGIVPDEILDRKRKAYVVRAPAAAINARWDDIRQLTKNMVAESLGILSGSSFLRVLESARDGRSIVSLPAQRMLQLEGWLRSITKHAPYMLVEKSALTRLELRGEGQVSAG